LFFIALIVSVAAFDKAVLKSGLQSAEGQIKLFNNWVNVEHKHFSGAEKSFRFRIFREHLKEIVEINDAQEDYELDANFMSGLTDEEQQQWYGINITAFPAAPSDEEPAPLLSMPSSGSKLWREENKITAVKNQGGCGSCWAFAGTAAFEGHYAIKSGGLKRFAEQEPLDCTYEGQSHNGCKGGWYWEAYDRVLKKNQHWALEKDYPYTAKDGRCQVSNKPNGMKAAQMVKTVRPRKSSMDGSLVQALNEGPVAMAFEIKGGFNYYKKGVLTINNCGSTPHHAMAVTGYTPEFFEIKNSWGGGWGDRGYVRFSRKVQNMCGISNWLAYPQLKKTGNDDSDAVDPTEGGDDSSCADKNDRCKEWADRGECKDSWQYMGENCKKSCNICGCSDAVSDCARWQKDGHCSDNFSGFMKVMCRKACGICKDDGGDKKCPDALVWCNGGCNHEHFCH